MIRSVEMESIVGRMAQGIRECSKMTIGMAMARCFGLTGERTRAIGLMESKIRRNFSTAKLNSKLHTPRHPKEV